jgi:hypothetical protein
MFRVFYQSRFEPRQHGDGMWPPLAYAIDFLGTLTGISLILALLFAAWGIVPLIFH